jgi:succinate dehydrogenase / fumarate reductase iron-sulfur subunit/fumarate reductase iron-sulfur subunit
MRVRIKRFREGAFKESLYELDLNEPQTLLDILYRVREQDPTLSFRAMCRASVCGTCAVKLDGEHKLACNTMVSPESEEILVEPVDGSPPLKDLITQQEDIFLRMRSAKIWLGEAEGEVKLKPSDISRVQKSHDCILCGICNNVCPSLQTDPSFGGPSLFVKAFGIVEDVRNPEPDKSLKNLIPFNIQSCVHCKNCDLSCPKACTPEVLITLLEGKMLKKGYIQKKTEDFGFLGF